MTTALTEWCRSEIFVVWRTAMVATLSIWSVVFAIAAFEWPAGPATPAFVVQLFVAITACAAITVGMALQRMRRD